ncbi:MAG: DUF11 domain-containing protein [Caldilineaceae bacterium]|nr:DUF11 domain-containing protein [Caldilineaceae bacterium]
MAYARQELPRPKGVIQTEARSRPTSSTGALAGVTTHDNTATVSDAQTDGSRSSNTVTISISTNPNLRLVKRATPVDTVAAGGLITYTVAVSNIGSSDAHGVLLQDLTPQHGVYKPNTLVYEEVAQSDLADGDAGQFDAARNRNEITFVNVVRSTAVGGLRLRKSTIIPTIMQTLEGASATYLIQLENMLTTPSTGVVSTDTLPVGFTYLSISGINGGSDDK